MEGDERKHLIKALYEFAWKIVELRCAKDLRRLSKSEINDKLTEEATNMVVSRINITPDQLHSIIQELMLLENRW